MPSTGEVMLIDDDPGHAEILGEAVRSAWNEASALDWHRTVSSAVVELKDSSVRAIFLNLGLADGCELDVLTHLRTVDPATPIVLLGGAGDDARCRLAMSLGADDYLLEGHLDHYGFTQALRHLVERDTAQQALYLEQERAQVTLNSIGDAVLCVDLANQVTYLNRAAETMTGWTSKEASGHPVAEVFQVVDGATGAPVRNPLALAMDADKSVGLGPNSVLIQRDGRELAVEDSAAPIHDRDGRTIGAVIVFRDVSRARSLALEMAHLAQHDVLTGLPNRLLLKERLTQALLHAWRDHRCLAVLFIDLDGFKAINDSLGHAVGDALLQSVAARLSAGLRKSDTVSRQGGDEFVILLPVVAHAGDAVVKADRLLKELSRPHVLGEHELRVTASVGISVYPDDGQDAETLLKHADLAMYVAKRHGRNRAERFVPAMAVRTTKRHAMEGQFQTAIEEDQLVLHYQPKVHLGTGRLAGVEALVRWQHPQRGLLLPGEFLPIAEEIGLMTTIDRWVLNEACRQTREWLDAGMAAVPVAINISSLDLWSEDFADGIDAALRKARLGARFLELELTETVLMRHGGVAEAMLGKLHGIGVRLALDDFGTGFSSLSYLTRFAIDTVKIDRSFVHRIATSSADAEVATAIISLAKRLRHRVVAEGVETPEQLAFLRGQGCDEGQGYYFARPASAGQFSSWLGAAAFRAPERSHGASLEDSGSGAVLRQSSH
jgi:diguanylate cyclase (GGDEF)-like protein/PAS domain S-box-containing protein